MGVRRTVRFNTPDAPYLKTMPPTFQRAIAEHFLDMSKSSTVGTYNRELQNIHILDGSRSTRRHEMVHAINHFSSIYPSCSKCLPIPIRIAGWLMGRKSIHLQAIGFILNETLAHWVSGDKSFFLFPNNTYFAKALYLSKPIGRIWFYFVPVSLGLFFVFSQILIQVMIVYSRRS